jgi:endo-1,4-beta-xylanase
MSSLGLLMAACGAVPTLTATAGPSDTPLPTNLPSSTSTSSPIPSSTLTNTSAPTDTATRTETPTVTSTPTQTATSTPKPITLRTLADALGIEFGVGQAIGYLEDYNSEHFNLKPIVVRDFNLYVSVYELSWFIHQNASISLRPSRHGFYFKEVDKLVSFAGLFNMRVRGQHLLDNVTTFYPSWLLDGNFSRDELLAIIQEHVTTVVGQYKGRVHEWTVVNELFGHPWEPQNSEVWYGRLGPSLDWVELAFRSAHDADPDAKLILNGVVEFPGDPLYEPERADREFNAVNQFVQHGVPIDGVGFEMHVLGKDFVTQDQINGKIQLLKRNIARYRSLGIDVYVTEWDIRLGLVPGTQEARFNTQARAYAALLEACLEAGVRSLSLFGIPDKLNWLEDPNLTPPWGGPDADPTPFDDNYNPKPSCFALRDVLLSHVKQ